MSELVSSFYVGWVRHRRFMPAQNHFQYKIFMVYLDLQELPQVLKLNPFWSSGKFAPARFLREDFHGDPAVPLADAVRHTVWQQTGKKPEGPIRMLANWRYFGYNMNPLCTYYCFDKHGQKLEAILAEVNNTPWGEKHAYVLQCDSTKNKQEFSFAKAFHVSPFNHLAMQYHWHSTVPAETLVVHIENWMNRELTGEQRVMDATMVLERKELNRNSMSFALIRYPFMTVKIISAIYWQALRLWLKKVPFVSHPAAAVHQK